MRPKRLEKTRKGATTLVVAALVAAFSYGVSGQLVTHRPAFALTSGSGDPTFTITSTIYATPACSAPTVPLVPTVTRCLAVTVHNPYAIPIEVETISVTVTFTGPHIPECSATTLTLTRLSFTTLPVSVAGHGTHTIDKPIMLKTTDTTQGSCLTGHFTFSYSGTARYTDTTTTTLTASLTGTTVTLTATVTPANPTTVPYGPPGATVHHVTFYSCGTTATCTPSKTTSLGTVTLTTTGHTKIAKTTTAKTVTAPTTPGTYYYEATYPAKGTHTGTFTGSHSIEPITVTVVVPVADCVTPPTTQATKTITGTWYGNFVVPPGFSLYLDKGTITGNVVVDFGGSLATTGGRIGGNLTSFGIVSDQGTWVGGNVKALTGGLAIGPDSTIGGNLTGSDLFALCIVGTPSSHVRVGGNLTVQSLPFFVPPATICSATVHGNLTYVSNEKPVDIGGAGCADFIGGNLVVVFNSAKVAVDDNIVGGNIAVSDNFGGTLLTNHANGNCSLGPDYPMVIGSGNTVDDHHPNSCNEKA